MHASLRNAPAWYALALPVLSWLLSVCLLSGAGDPGPAARALAVAVSGLLTAWLLWPLLWRDAEPGLKDLVRWLLLTPGITLALLASTPSAAWLPLLPPLLAGVLLLILFLGALTLSLQRFARMGAHGTHRLVTTLLLLAGAAPLWLGPLAGRLAQPAFTNLVVALSPASYLAALIEVDLYRTAWCYAHTPLGGLRYDYPAATSMTLFYCGLAAVLLYLSGALARRGTRRDTETVSLHSLHEEPTP